MIANRSLPSVGESRPLALRLLGSFQAKLATGQVLDLPTKKTEALLAYLALRPGEAYARDRLAALLWGDTSDEQARKSLRQAVYLLRRILPATQPPILIVDDGTIAVDPRTVDVDAVEFERALGRGAPEALDQAITLYHGDLLEGLRVNEDPYEAWLVAERERLRELAQEALARLLAEQSKGGHPERAIRTAVKLLALDPSQEVVHRTLMRLYARQGRRGAALKQYQTCVAALQREVGTRPEPETQELYRHILQRPSEAPEIETSGPGSLRQGRRTARESNPEPTRPDPLVGRERELGRLRESLDLASRGRGHVVAIVGETGIGKSSILMALAAEARARGARSLLGRCYQTEQVLAFGPWVEALRSERMIADVAVLEGLEPHWRAELARLLPELGDPDTAPASTPLDHLRLFEGSTELVRGLAAEEPVLVALEDVHWADEMTLRLIAFLARRTRSARVLVVLTMREEELASAPLLGRVIDELGAEPHFVHLTLWRLTPPETRALARSLTGAACPGAIVARLDQQIWRASGGNPFIVVETVRAALEDGPADTSAILPLPERVRRLIAGRLERVSERGRHVASVAAVIGREFDFALLRSAAGLGEHETAEGVEELVRRRMLNGLGERFAFTHEWIREVVYDQLPEPRRKALHVLVAEAFGHLDVGDLELYAALAGHYRAGEVWQKALTCLRQAGGLALRLSAHRDAAAYFNQALAVLARVPSTRQTLETAIDLRFDLRSALHPLAELDTIRGHLEDAEGLARTLDDQRRLGWVSAYMSHYFRMAGRPTEAIEPATTAQNVGRALADPALRLWADLHLGAAWISAGDYRRAVDLLRQAVQSLGDDLSHGLLGNPEFPSVFARAWLTLALAELGEFAEGIACGAIGIRLAEAVDHPLSLACACTRLGQLHAVQGDLDQAARLLERARGLTRDRQIVLTGVLATGDLGHVYARLGRADEGLSLLREAMDASESLKLEGVKPRLLVHLGEAQLLAGRFADAHACAGRSLVCARDRAERGWEAYALHLLGEVESHREPPDVEAAEGRYRESMSLAGALDMQPLIAHCHRGLGTLYRRAGKTHAACEHLAAASVMFRRMGMGSWLEEAEGDLLLRDRVARGPAASD